MTHNHPQHSFWNIFYSYFYSSFDISVEEKSLLLCILVQGRLNSFKRVHSLHDLFIWIKKKAGKTRFRQIESWLYTSETEGKQTKTKNIHETHQSTRYRHQSNDSFELCILKCRVPFTLYTHPARYSLTSVNLWCYHYKCERWLTMTPKLETNWHIANMLLPNSTEYTNLIKCWTTSIQNRFKGKTLYRLVALSEIRQKKQLRSFDLSFELMFFEGTLMEQMDEMKNVLAQLLCNFTSNNNNMSLAVGQVFYAIFRNVVAISRQQLKRYWMRLVSFNLIDYAELLCSQLTQIRVEEYIRYEAEQRKKNQWI